jgi:RNA polymerase sigma-70 factor, ECF subfamily
VPELWSESQLRDLLAGLVESHGWLYYKLAYRVLRHRQAARDACQQAFVKAIERLKELRSVHSLNAWISTVVIREALQMRRRLEIESRVLAKYGSSDFAPEEEDWISREAVREALLQLPDETRTIVVYRIVEKLSGAEVKKIMGCSESHISRQLHHGMDLLRGLLPDFRTTLK